MGLPIVTALMGIFVGAAGVGVLSAVHGRPRVLADPVRHDRPRRRHRLRAVHRHPPPPAPPRGHERRGRRRHRRSPPPARPCCSPAPPSSSPSSACSSPASRPSAAMGAAVALVVTVSMVAAITLLPGLLGLAGTKIDKLSIHRKSHVAKPADETVSGRWAHHVGSHPVRYAIVGLVALCAIAVPALSMRIGTPDDGNAATDTTQRIAYDQLADGFGPGFNGPIQVVVELPTAGRPGGRRPGPRRAAGRPRRRRGHRAGASTPPATPPCSPPTRPRRRRTSAPTSSSATSAPTCCPATVAGTDARVSLTGQAMVTDLTDRITEPAAALHRRRRGDVVPAADDRVPLDPRPAQGRAHEPAVDRRRLRRARRRVPVGLGQRAHRAAQHDADQPVPAADHVRHPLRALDGLRGVPPVPGPRGVRGDRRQPRSRGRAACRAPPG